MHISIYAYNFLIFYNKIAVFYLGCKASFIKYAVSTATAGYVNDLSYMFLPL